MKGIVEADFQIIAQVRAAHRSALATATKGTLTLKLTVAPSKLAMGGTVVEVEATHDCQIKKPELATGRSMFFVAPDGRSLMRDDPAQTAMFGVEEVQHNG